MTPPISRYPVPPLEDLPDDVRTRILEVQEKSGFVPNVFLAFSHRPDEFRAFFAYHDALMLKPSGLSKGEKEMIVVATSGANRCLYCVVAHGAVLRIYEKAPQLADQVATNYLKADLTPRQKVLLAFAMKVCTDSGSVVDEDFERLRAHGFSDEDIWDIGRGRRVLRAVEPHGEPDRAAPQRRVLPDGPPAPQEALRHCGHKRVGVS